MKRRLLLLSNSTNPGEPYLGWPRKYLSDFMSGSGVKDILFVPYAGVGLSNISLEKSYDVYEQRVQAVFGDLGLHIRSVHHCDDPISAINDAGAIAVGGGNTFHLVYMMHKLNIMKAIRERVLKGISFIGWSAQLLLYGIFYFDNPWIVKLFYIACLGADKMIVLIKSQ